MRLLVAWLSASSSLLRDRQDRKTEISAVCGSTPTQERLDLAIASIKEEMQSHEQTKEAMQSESIARHTLAQQVADLKERLTENEVHRKSLEEKHNHARDALEHYRSSIKEQRDQDLRRHDQQVQQFQSELSHLKQSLVLKQQEVTQLNQDGVRLVAELSQAQKSLYEEKNHHRRLDAELETQRAIAQRVSQLEALLDEKNAQITGVADQNKEMSSRISSLQLELATTSAKLEAQQLMMAELKTYLGAREVLNNDAITNN